MRVPKLADLGITPSHSQQRVSNDNTYSESLFRTVKYCPQWPANGFATLEIAREWMSEFVQWYNHKHRHSKIKFITPDQRHKGEDNDVLMNCVEVYTQAKAKNPERWSSDTCDWNPVLSVTLNPEKVR